MTMEELFFENRYQIEERSPRTREIVVRLGCETSDVKTDSSTAKRSEIGVSVTGLRKWLY